VAQDYLDFCVRHIRAERDLMPALRQAVSDAEWNDIGCAFASVDDPVAKARSQHGREAALARFD
jgi:hypothetical protein